MSGSAFDSRYVQVDLESAVPAGERTHSNFRDKAGEARRMGAVNGAISMVTSVYASGSAPDSRCVRADHESAVTRG